MKKYILLLLTLFSAVTLSSAQSAQDTIVVVPAKQGMYFYHVVSKEETIYSLSRRYHVDPKELADFNHLTLKSELQIFQLVKIPLNKENFDQSSSTNIASYIPLYHKVLKGETLYHIGELHDKVPDALLQKWNRLAGNDVKAGQYLIVGWLKTGSGNSEVAANNTIAPSSQSLSNVPPPDKVDNATDALPPKKQKMERPHANNNIANPDNGNSLSMKDKDASSGTNNPGNSGNTNNSNNTNNTNNSNNSGNSNNAFLNEVIASENSSRNIHHAPPPADENNNAFSVKLNKPKPTEKINIPEKAPKSEDEKKRVTEKKEVQKKETIKSNDIAFQPRRPEKPDSFDMMLNRVTESPKASRSVEKQKAIQSASSSITQSTQQNSDQQTSQPMTQVAETSVAEPVTVVASGFEQQYDQETNNGANVDSRKGAAGWFKSNVKPGSGRYYALCNDLPRGTVVKVANPLNGKSILVKVLDVIPKGAENYNLIIKISDAAMNDLGVTQSRFWCEIQYPKQ